MIIVDIAIIVILLISHERILLIDFIFIDFMLFVHFLKHVELLDLDVLILLLLDLPVQQLSLDDRADRSKASDEFKE